jgi:two-component system sensor histidine kinase PilS (NtrC family)
VARVSTRLAKLVDRRKKNPFARPPSFTAADGETVVIPRFTELGSPEQPGTLIFLEDSSLQGQRAQEMKLAALGRFTASIAHELRNPLAAISHANQLLSESERLGEEEHHFNEIISRHTDRVNRIIETVLKLSRREATEPKTLALNEWLHSYRDELIETGRFEASELTLELPESGITARMDADHLHQVMDNLIQNARRHRDEESGLPIRIRLSLVGERQRPCLEVLNPGPAIPEEDAVHIFEPFYTASPRGTGLGLFVARELCDCNRAKLEYRYEEGMNNFRILFSDPERWLA